MCESRGGRPGLPSLIILMVSLDVLTSLIVFMVVKHQERDEGEERTTTTTTTTPSICLLTEYAQIRYNNVMVR